MKYDLPLDCAITLASIIVDRHSDSWVLKKALRAVVDNIPFRYGMGDDPNPVTFNVIGENGTLRDLCSVPDRELLLLRGMEPAWVSAIRQMAPYGSEYAADSEVSQVGTGPVQLLSGGPIEATITLKGPEDAIVSILNNFARLLSEDTIARRVRREDPTPRT
jgi:hypothetical protein